jgi:hypothetical protein
VRAERVQFLGAPGQPKAAAPVDSVPAELPAETTEDTWLNESEDKLNEG